MSLKIILEHIYHIIKIFFTQENRYYMHIETQFIQLIIIPVSDCETSQPHKVSPYGL